MARTYRPLIRFQKDEQKRGRAKGEQAEREGWRRRVNWIKCKKKTQKLGRLRINFMSLCVDADSEDFIDPEG